MSARANRRVPALGHASRTEAILAMRQDCLTTPEIAARLGIAPHDVAALETGAARGRAVSPGRGVLFPLDLLARLGPHASRRGVHPHSLARKIIETVLDEGMVDAVLDDGEGAP